MFGWLRTGTEVAEADVIRFLVRRAAEMAANGQRERASLFTRCALTIQVEHEERIHVGDRFDEWGGHQ